MSKIVIVDDEPLIANGLKKLINQSNYPLEVVPVFYSSKKALEYCSTHTVDIILTDINMPELNGLELIRLLKEKKPTLEAIILTGFGSYSYAKEAITLGVHHFLEKPIRKFELEETLRKVLIKTEKNKIEQQLFIKEQIERFLSNSDCCSWPSELDFPMHLYTYDSTYYPTIYNALEPIIDTYSMISGHIKKTGYFLFSDTFIDTNQVLSLFKELIDKNIFILYSYNLNSESLKNNINQARNYFDRQFYFDEVTIYSQNDIFKQWNPELYTQFQLNFFKALDKRELHLALTLIDQLFIEYKKSLYPVQLVRLQIIDLLETFFKRFPMNKDPLFIDYAPKIMLLNNWKDVHYLVTHAIHLLETALEVENESSIVKKVNLIIEKYYNQEQLSMKWLANTLLFLNPDYVGKVYQQQTGQRFTTRLTNYRIEKAKELLNDNYKVYEVSSMVGFGNSPEYFVQLFKKHVGKTPKQYTIKQKSKQTL